MPSFFEGFGSGLSQGMERRRLKDVFDWQKEQATSDRDFRERQFEQQQSNSDRSFELQQQEHNDLQAARQAQQEAEQARIDLQKKSVDFEVLKGTMTLFNSDVKPNMKKFMLKQMAPSLGIDPGTDAYKDFEKLLTSVDPDQAQQVRDLLVAAAPKAKPGQITAFVQGIISGKLTMAAAMEQLNHLGQSQVLEQAFPGPQPGAQAQEAQAQPGVNMLDPTFVSRQGGLVPNRVTPTQQVAPEEISTPDDVKVYIDQANALFRSGNFEAGRAKLSQLNAIKDQLPSTMKRRIEFETQKAMAAAEAEQKVIERHRVEPGLVNALGLDPHQRFTTQDILDQDFVIPMDPKEQQKVADKIRDSSRGATQTIVSATKLVDLFDEKPETLGITGSFVQVAESLGQQLKGAARALGIEDNIDLKALEADAEKIANKLVGTLNLEGTAKNVALIKSGTLALAYDMALSQGLAGSRLTNARVKDFLNQIGESGSPEQFKATLQNLVKTTMDDYGRSTQTLVGRSLLPDVRLLSDSDIVLIAKRVAKDGPGVFPLEYRQAILAEIDRREQK